MKLDYKTILANPKLLYCVCLVVGIGLGVTLYPSKTIEEKVTLKYQKQIETIQQEDSKKETKYQEQIASISSEYKKSQIDYEKKLSVLTTENKKLKSERKTTYYKIIKPDGTVEIRATTESSSSEDSTLVSQMQEEMKKKVEEAQTNLKQDFAKRETTIKEDYESRIKTYQTEIQELKSSKVTTINAKKFGAEVGITTKLNYYGHMTYDFAGPFFLGVHATSASITNPMFELGGGLGIRW